jgi:predicted TIM-barrel fold metal-dependent hydrolase
VTVMMHGSGPAAMIAQSHENIVLATGPLGGPRFLETALERLDPRGIVFTTRSPIGFPELELRILELSTISEQHRRLIMGENIKRILGL